MGAPRILIIGPSWVGDMVMAQSLFMLLKQRTPSPRIDVLAPAWSRPILARMPEVSEILDMPVGHGKVSLGVRRNLAKGLRSHHYDQAIVLPNSLKSALIPWWANIPQRTGWRGEMRYGLLNDLRKLDKSALPLMVQRFDALAVPKGAPLPTNLPHPALVTDAANQQTALGKFELSTEKAIVALCPGAEFGASKRWPEDHYATVARQQIQAGRQVWIFGSQNDAAVGKTILQSMPEELRQHCHNLAGRTNLAEAVDLLALANVVISNDSGLMHVAAALKRPLIVVYGSTSPDFTPPLADDVRILRLGLECSPCFERECPLGHLKCLRELSPEVVLNALNDLIPSKG
ncbi:lipopolysaccharide heptosyltransferase II [Mangrovitalea sediminis]|uniref:lipopolysaccharide heptosyltransferase II n=1 Tax=Mangrovitalea sediminis TaxID=1982043 RepID=UPI001D0D1488|nr:lipopolysaccharide heptosyltransferase II [Mangrovitalea sediminis]